jgi:hypothetical protein
MPSSPKRETTMIHNVELKLGVPGSIAVDGVQLGQAVRGVQLSQEQGCLPRVIVDLLLLDVSVLAGAAEIEIPAATQAALRVLGWTPPDEAQPSADDTTG